MARFSCCRCTWRCWKPRIPSPTAVYTVFSTLLEMSSVDGRGTPWTLAEAGGGRGGGSAAGNGPFATLRVVVESEEQPLASPPVLVVVVTHGLHADRFEVLLGALAEQDYPELSVLVVDAAGGTAPSTGSAPLSPAARVLHVPGPAGFATAANHVLDPDRPQARLAEFFVFCHDDVLPDTGAVSALVGAATEGDADVVGPKFVARDDPRRLLHVGLGVDRVGTTMPARRTP